MTPNEMKLTLAQDAFYAIQPGNGLGLFYNNSAWDPHGPHCMQSSTAVFSIHEPYRQLIHILHIYTKFWRDFQLGCAEIKNDVDDNHNDNGREDSKVTDEHSHL